MIEGIGVSNQLAKAAFSLTPAAPLAGPFQVGGSFVVVRLKERKDPDLAEFEKRKDELAREAQLTKWIGSSLTGRPPAASRRSRRSGSA